MDRKGTGMRNDKGTIASKTCVCVCALSQWAVCEQCVTELDIWELVETEATAGVVSC